MMTPEKPSRFYSLLNFKSIKEFVLLFSRLVYA